EHGTKEFNHLLKTISGIGDIPVSRMNKRALMDYRSMRLRDGISAATINRDMYRLSGMFTKLIQLDEFSGQHPIHGLPP
ncbi:site-specific integrase, partial [Escherichia coli]|nr:site-specific integrase [Escherichia coli]